MAKILIIDDEAMMRTLLRKALKEYGECVVTEDGRSGLIAYEDAVFNNEPFDVVFIDVMMKGKNGVDVLKEIRDREKKRNVEPEKGVKVVMISGQPDADMVKKCIIAGCNKFIVKPFVIASITDAIDEFGFKPVR